MRQFFIIFTAVVSAIAVVKLWEARQIDHVLDEVKKKQTKKEQSAYEIPNKESLDIAIAKQTTKTFCLRHTRNFHGLGIGDEVEPLSISREGPHLFVFDYVLAGQKRTAFCQTSSDSKQIIKFKST